jgi:hypothetical protein
MVSERDVIGLLYRADWARLALSGTVTGAEPVLETAISVRSDEPLSGPWQREDTDPPPEPPPGLFEHMPPWASRRMEEQLREAWHGKASGSSWTFEPNGQGAAFTLAVAPGRRFRADGADGTWALGCDGARMWHWFRDLPAGTSVSFGLAGLQERPPPPYRDLLAPSWLLTGYSLALGDEVTVAGRAGVQVRGTLRAVAAQTTRIGGRPGRSVGAGGLFAPIPRWINGFPDEVEAVIDLELGILLRCSKRPDDGPQQVTEFSSLDVPGRAEASVFTAPPGSGFGGDKGSRTRGPDSGQSGGSSGAAGSTLGDALGEALETAGKEAAKAVAGLAAGGLGALIRYAPRRQPADPFAQATAEAADPEAEMPADEPAPDGPGDAAAPAPQEGGLPDEVLHLVYRSGLTVPTFRATLHQWFDASAVLAAVPQSARGTGFGGVGFLVDAVRDRAKETAAGASHEVSTVAMGGWTEYRIDVMRPAADAASLRSGRQDSNRARTIASDGTRTWQVFADRVVTGPAAPPPGDLADLADASWLLDADLELSGGTEVSVGGRRAYRVVARHREDAPPGTSWWERLFFPAVAVVDAETGLVLRLTRFKGGRAAMRQELRDIAVLEAGADFGFTPPPGRPVHQAGSPPGESEPGSWAWSRDPAFWAWDPRR